MTANDGNDGISGRHLPSCSHTSVIAVMTAIYSAVIKMTVIIFEFECMTEMTAIMTRNDGMTVNDGMTAVTPSSNINN
jgi:hypothetical protein